MDSYDPDSPDPAEDEPGRLRTRLHPQNARDDAPGTDPRTAGVGRADDDVRSIVLVVEDDDDDWDLIRWAFEECRHQVRVERLRNGEETLDWIFRGGRFRDARDCPRPSLVLLDLRLPGPGVGGFEVLRRVRDCPATRVIPVVVFSGLDDDHDVARAYDLGANSWLSKPDSTGGYRKIIRVLESYWLRQAVLPPEAS